MAIPKNFVEELRSYDEGGEPADGWYIVYNDLQKAADEIERLRRNLAGAYRDQGCAEDEIAEYLELDLYPESPLRKAAKASKNSAGLT